MHEGKPFIPMPQGIGKSCEHSQYFIKIYNKGAQFNLPENILRIENRVRTMDYLHSKGIYIRSLADLLNVHNLKLLGNNLLSRFNEILFFDSTIEIENLREKDQLVLLKARIPSHWTNLGNKSKVDQFRKKYNQLYNAHKKIDWKLLIGKEIKKNLEIIYNTPLVCSNIEHSLEYTQGLLSLPDYKKMLNEPIVEVSDSVLSLNEKLPSEQNQNAKVSDSVIPFKKPMTFSRDVNKISDSVNNPISKYISSPAKELVPEIWMVVHLHDVFHGLNLPERIHLPSKGMIIDVQSFVNDHLHQIDCHYREPAYQQFYDRLLELLQVLSKREYNQMTISA